MWRSNNCLPANHSVTKTDNDAISRLYEQGKTDTQIARTLGISDTTVAKWREEAGVPGHGSKTRSWDTDLALRMYKEGSDDMTIGREISVGVESVRAWRKENDLPTNRHRLPYTGRKELLANPQSEED